MLTIFVCTCSHFFHFLALTCSFDNLLLNFILSYRVLLTQQHLLHRFYMFSFILLERFCGFTECFLSFNNFPDISEWIARDNIIIKKLQKTTNFSVQNISNRILVNFVISVMKVIKICYNFVRLSFISFWCNYFKNLEFIFSQIAVTLFLHRYHFDSPNYLFIILDIFFFRKKCWIAHRWCEINKKKFIFFRQKLYLDAKEAKCYSMYSIKVFL